MISGVRVRCTAFAHRDLAPAPCQLGCGGLHASVAPQESLTAHTADHRCALLRSLLQGYGVFRFEDKYGANVDGYSPIYTPDLWTESGDSYKLGTKGLIAW